MNYPELEILDVDDEALLRKLVAMDRNKKQQVGEVLFSATRNSRNGTLVRHLDQAHMLNVGYTDGDPSVYEVYAAGYSYVATKDLEIKAEEQRRRERREDKWHNWRISVFSAVAGVIGVVIGFVLGRM